MSDWRECRERARRARLAVEGEGGWDLGLAGGSAGSGGLGRAVEVKSRDIGRGDDGLGGSFPVSRIDFRLRRQKSHHLFCSSTVCGVGDPPSAGSGGGISSSSSCSSTTRNLGCGVNAHPPGARLAIRLKKLFSPQTLCSVSFTRSASSAEPSVGGLRSMLPGGDKLCRWSRSARDFSSTRRIRWLASSVESIISSKVRSASSSLRTCSGVRNRVV
jgi:hypothetical protein